MFFYIAIPIASLLVYLLIAGRVYRVSTDRGLFEFSCATRTEADNTRKALAIFWPVISILLAYWLLRWPMRAIFRLGAMRREPYTKLPRAEIKK